MLSPEDLFKAKREYGTILIQEINTIIYTFRLLSPEDYRLVIHPGTIEDEDIEEIVCNICVLDPIPVDFDELDYNVSGLAQLIIQESGLKSPEELLSSMTRVREEIATDSLDFIISQICSVFPTYNPDQLEKKPVPKLLKLLAIAEKIGGKEIITPQLFKKMAKGRPQMEHPPNPVNVMGNKWHKTPTQVSEDQTHNMQTSEDALSHALGNKIK